MYDITSMTGEQFVTLCKIIGGIATAGGGLYSAYQYVLRPYVVEPYILEPCNLAWKVITDANSIHDIIKKEFTTNGGSSIKDAIKRIESSLDIMNSKYRTILALDERAIWETDANGNYIWVNDTYIRETGFSMDFLKDDGWLSMIDENERHRVRESWNECIVDSRGFISKLLIHKSNGTAAKVATEAYPVISKEDNKLVGYIGLLNFVDTVCLKCPI